jgi:DNA-binding YbaB/EbfC family protein
MANMMQMMQKAQKFKEQMELMQARVQQMELEGAAGGGLVTCKVTGKFEMRSIKIDPALIKAEEADVLEDLIVAAVNDARLKAEKTMAEETEKLMRDMGLPPGMGLPF